MGKGQNGNSASLSRTDMDTYLRRMEDGLGTYNMGAHKQEKPRASSNSGNRPYLLGRKDFENIFTRLEQG